MRPPPFHPVPPPPLLNGRPFPDMRIMPPRLPPPMVDRRYLDERSPPPLPFDWLPPPGDRSPPYMDRYSPRDDDLSPASFHSSASLSRTNVTTSTPGNRTRMMSPPRLGDRGPPHVARPRPELGVASSAMRGTHQYSVNDYRTSDSCVFCNLSLFTVSVVCVVFLCMIRYDSEYNHWIMCLIKLRSVNSLCQPKGLQGPT